MHTPLPCPTAITVLVPCIQLKQFGLGRAPVACFSAGLALTMVSTGVLAALGVKHVASRWSGPGAFARRAPDASAALIVLDGLCTGCLGRDGIRREHRDRAAASTLRAPTARKLPALDLPMMGSPICA